MSTAVSGRAWLLYGAMAVLWGIPYLFIKEAVDSYSPAAIVAGRTLLGAVLLLPLAIRSGALRPALKLWPWVLAFGAIEMAGPFFLLGSAEQTLPSGLTGLLVATVPLFAAGIALARGDRTMLSPPRAIGLAVGFIGVGIIVVGPGLAVADPASALAAIGQVLLVAFLYAVAPFIIATKLAHVPSLGTITLSLLVVGIAYLPIALLTQHEVPTVRSTVSLVALGILCTALGAGFRRNDGWRQRVRRLERIERRHNGWRHNRRHDGHDDPGHNRHGRRRRHPHDGWSHNLTEHLGRPARRHRAHVVHRAQRVEERDRWGRAVLDDQLALRHPAR
ncbi:MAG: hypothetical protein DI566_02475 [Microbacterium sp.]|nr:MAG: hypothetical protein DI566_02475 [Microbacterium sp.]